MQSSEVRSRSVLVFGAGAVVGAGVTWFIMSATTSRRPSTSSSRQRYGAQLRRILADLELRLTDAVDQLVARLSVSCTTDADHQKLSSSESSRNQLTPRDDQQRPSKSQCVCFSVRTFAAELYMGRIYWAVVGFLEVDRLALSWLPARGAGT